MLIEKDLGMPILQVDCAKNLISPKAAQVFGGRQSENCTAIAILHSRKLVISAIVN